MRPWRTRRCALDQPEKLGDVSQVSLGDSFARLLPADIVELFNRRPATEPVRIFRLRNVLLDAWVMVLFKGRRPIPETLFLINQAERDFAMQRPLELELTDASRHYILGATRAHHNYYHWMVQSLPAIDWGLRCRRDDSVALALPALQPWQEQTLALLGHAGVPRLTLGVREHYPLASVEFSEFLSGRLPGIVSNAAAATYGRLRQAVAPAADGATEIYVARTDATNRVAVNEAELIAMLEREGVRIVVPGTLPVSRQIALFRKASLVIGAHGAGLSNIMACEAGTAVYELLPSHYPNICFNRLAQACGLHYWGDVFPSDAGGGRSAGPHMADRPRPGRGAARRDPCRDRYRGLTRHNRLIPARGMYDFRVGVPFSSWPGVTRPSSPADRARIVPIDSAQMAGSIPAMTRDVAGCRTSLFLRPGTARRESTVRSVHSKGQRLGRQQGVQLAGPVQRHQVVAAADMPTADEDLRHCGAAAGAPCRLGAGRRSVRRVDLVEGDALAAEQVDGTFAEWAPGLGVDLDFRHCGHLRPAKIGMKALPRKWERSRRVSVEGEGDREARGRLAMRREAWDGVPTRSPSPSTLTRLDLSRSRGRGYSDRFGSTCSPNSRIDASASASGRSLKFTCTEAISNPPTCRW